MRSLSAREVVLIRVRPTLSYQRLQTFQPLSDRDLHEKIRKTVSNKHELQVLEALLIFNKSVSYHLRAEVQPTDFVIETCSGPTFTNRPRSLYPSGLPQNSCRRPSTLESRTGCSSSSVTSSEDSISGSETSHEVEFESSRPEIGRTIPSTRGCCLFFIIPLGPETDSPIPASTKTTVSPRPKP